MFERVMFFIVLALFILTPAGLVYANNQVPQQPQDSTLDLGNYKIVPTPPKLWFIINSEAWNSSQGSVHSTPNAACAALYSVAAGYFAAEGSTRRKLTGYKVNLISEGFSANVCLLKRSVEYKKTDGTYTDPQIDNLSYVLQSKDNPASCPDTSEPKYLGWYVNRVTSTPPTGACWASCEHVYKPSGVTGVPFARPNNHSAGISQLAIPDATTNGKSCDLNMCSPDDPECSKPDEPPPEDCTAAQKTANGGQCPKPDADGNKCNESEKAGNGGKCQTPDPNGTKCPTAQKTGAGGTCSGSGDGDGNGSGDGQCTPEQKAANGGQCPAGAGGTCTANPINKKICDFIDAFNKPVPDATDGKVDVKNQTASDVGLTPQQFDTNRVQFGAYCPPASVKSMSFGGESVSIEISYQPLCDFLAFIKYIIIAAASFAAAYILSGVRS